MYSHEDDIQVFEELETFSFKPLYKRDSSNSVRVWSISYNSHEKECTIEYGLLEGKKINSSFKIDIKGNKSILEQALIRMKRRYIDKMKEGYSTILKDNLIVSPMLAQPFNDKIKVNYPVAVMPKLDGVRCIVRINGDSIELFSRQNNSLEHLYSHFEESLKLFTKFLPPNIDIDGELYSHILNFNSITSIVRKTKKTSDEELSLIQYHIYDCIIPDTPFEERWKILKKTYSKYIKNLNFESKIELVDCELVENEEELMKYYSKCLEDNYEGSIVRRLYYSDPTPSGLKRSIYRGVRCCNIMKLKPTIEEEATVIDVVSAKGREDGKALLKVKDKRGNEFMTRPATTFEIRNDMLNNPERIIGKIVTLKYLELTPDGIPRGPVTKDFRDYE